MKAKFMAIAALPVLLLAACAEEEPVAPQAEEATREAISFRPSMSGLSRASEITNANLSDINVTALLDGQNYFSDLVFSKDNTGFYNSAKSYYWPGDTSTLDFYAYYPSMDVMGCDVTINKDTKEITSFQTAENIADQVDLITAHGTGTKAKNEAAGVPLEFKHRLAQIEIRAKSNNPSYTFTVKGVRIGRPQYLGTFNMADSSWTLDEWHDTFVLESSCDSVVLSSTPVSIMGASGNAMLIPQTLVEWNHTGDPDNAARGTYLSVLVRIVSDTGVQMFPFPSESAHTAELFHHHGYAWAAIPFSGTWEQGKKYIYTLDFTEGAGYVDPDGPTPGQPVMGEPIKVVSQVEDWTEDDIPVSMKPTEYQ
ncbi:MAG: fimbrillin family protein [Bacteroidales bacterium]|nr:fimbrillin family protein [Bacteroidales bacterium]